MKILIVTAGTRGDVQPYIGLSQKLKKVGHCPVIAASKVHEVLIRRYDIKFHCIDDNSDTSQIQNVVKEKGLKAIKTGLKLLFDGLYLSHERIMEIVPDYDAVIGHGWIGETEADLLHKKFIRVGISANIAQKIKSKTGSILKKLQISLEETALNQLIIKPYNLFRKSVGAEKTSLAAVHSKPLFIPLSNVFINNRKLWNKHTFQSSYWYADNGAELIPDRVSSVLKNGRKNLVLNFGSMTSGKSVNNKYVEPFLESAAELDLNLIWIGRNNFNTALFDSSRITCIDEIPLEFIFPHTDCIIQHCGLGTVSEVIRSGVPSIPAPHAVDQFDSAKRLIKLGIAGDILKVNNMTKAAVIIRLNSVLNDTGMKKKTVEIKKIVENEIAEDKTVSLLEELLNDN